jgi:Uma2 family endonuclease
MAHAGRARASYTYAEYAALPGDGRRWELIDGGFEVNPAPTPRHQRVSRRLQFALMQQLEEPGLAEVFNAPIDVILSEKDVLQPDLAIVAAGRDIISDRGIEGPPDLVVEVLSPRTSVLDRRVKSVTYFVFGVLEYWVVDPDVGSVELFRPGADGYESAQRFDRASTLVTPSFGEVSIPLARVFR